ncbi:hypothetical protein BDA96_10G292400 [Sorghum bicolor]|uniref:Uncharacterized protein n=2 Tax=Sorghum bicolor TaxID=4558 RepID=A0A1W0VUD2_SORBI|nr:hypothetical protein BDA96_10G292400 [Sorghum bicolor]OQU76871.1 hypothetical protein SORBI_3010G225701 [Sorghum bicolor]
MALAARAICYLLRSTLPVVATARAKPCSLTAGAGMYVCRSFFFDLGMQTSIHQLNDHEDGRLQAAAAAGAGGGGRFPGDLQQLIALGDRRLQAASFFLAWGCCVLINTTVMNPAANLEHKFVGFVVLTIGAWLALLTLAGAGAGRAAARAERFLMELFF